MSVKKNTLGALRQQAALSDADKRIIIVSNNPAIQKLDLQMISTYPDTVDNDGKWIDGGVFKIQVEPKP